MAHGMNVCMDYNLLCCQHSLELFQGFYISSFYYFMKVYDVKKGLFTQIVEKCKSIELLLVPMRSFFTGVAVQQPIQVLL